MSPAGQAALRTELESEEGLRLHAYQDRGGVWTIGYGHTGPEVRLGKVWTQVQAAEQLSTDIAHVEQQLAKYLSWWGHLDDARQDAMADLAFNVGVGELLTWHHFLGAMQPGDFDRAAANLLATQPWASQVGSRAQRLAALVRTGLHVA